MLRLLSQRNKDLDALQHEELSNAVNISMPPPQAAVRGEGPLGAGAGRAGDMISGSIGPRLA